MAVYFVTEADVPTGESYPVKIGYSGDLKRRRGQLQTGNWRKLILMGHITDGGSKEGLAREKELHRTFGKLRIDQSEWFWMEPQQVLEALNLYSTYSYLSVGSEPYEIISFDRDGVPEFASPWDWGEVEPDAFCPACGWACGWTYSENWGGMFCLECGVSEHNFATDH